MIQALLVFYFIKIVIGFYIILLFVHKRVKIIIYLK